VANARLLDAVLERSDTFRRDPLAIFPWLLGPCPVRVLLVTDGGLDFSDQDFGLSTFVAVLRDEMLTYVQFDLTLAHLRSDVTDEQVMAGAPRITRSIKDFRFDEPNHFRTEDFDQVWLFGIDTFYHYSSYEHRNANKASYPADRLSDAELAVLSGFMNGGGGLFATGDHGLLGRNLSGSVTRARSMRLWGPTSPDPEVDEVSMGGPRRNDTNRIGHDRGSQFNDQSDDVPQEIQPTLYSARFSFLEARWPHPLLCGPHGVIRVLPDHPHEGECVLPSDLSAVYPIDGSAEYPAATGGGAAVPPEIVARSTVPAGNDADGTKLPTVAHSFGAIAAYDGHRAGIGRVVTDATWHHFVNVNLVGEVALPETEVKGRGFLASTAGEAHFEEIKTYYRNIAVWIAPPSAHRCFRRKLIWSLLYQHRVLEAVLTTPAIALDRADATLLYEIGIHARDVLNRAASRCQSLQIVFDLVRPEIPQLIAEIDPWAPPPPEPGPPFPPFANPGPLLDIALGGALLALREEFPMSNIEIRGEVDERGDAAIERGAAAAVRLGVRSFREGLGSVADVVGGG
jgi:hypothetical protein